MWTGAGSMARPRLPVRTRRPWRRPLPRPRDGCRRHVGADLDGEACAAPTYSDNQGSGVGEVGVARALPVERGRGASVVDCRVAAGERVRDRGVIEHERGRESSGVGTRDDELSVDL